MSIKRFKVRTRLKLMKHQEDYLQWAAKVNNPACIMEMRLGKTLANIRLIKHRSCFDSNSRKHPILVVCPSAVIEAWEMELSREMEKYTVIGGKSPEKRISAVLEAFENYGRTWVLVNYESLLYTPELVNLSWFAVLLDESTVIKNPDSEISKLCTKDKFIRTIKTKGVTKSRTVCSGFSKVKYRIILTGLPSPEGPLDLFQQYFFLNRSFMGCTNYYQYRNTYFYLSWNGWQPKTGMKEKIQAEMHKLSFVLTRDQAGIGSKKIQSVRSVEMTADQRRVYKVAEEEFTAILKSKGEEVLEERETDHHIVQRTWLARTTGGCSAEGIFKWKPKYAELLSLLRGELRNMPVVVWFRFDAEIKAVQSFLKSLSIPCQTLTGSDTRLQKKDKQEWFRTCLSPGRVFLCQQQKVAEYGVDMSVASVAIYYSYVYSGQTVAQTQDRIAHPNKKEPLLYIYLVAEDSIDEDAVTAIRAKVASAKGFLTKFKEAFLKRRGITLDAKV